MEQELGDGWTQGVHPEDFDYCLNIYTTHFDQRKPFSMEYRLRNYKNEYRWILDLGNPRYDIDGRFLGFIGYCYDITDRKQDEENLKTKTQELEHANNKLTLLSTVFTQSCEGIIITLDNGICVDINDSFVSLTGYDRTDIIGHNPSILKSGHHPTEFYSKMWDDLKSKSYWQGEVWNRGKNGNLYVVQLSISAVKDRLGTTSHYVGIFHDITNIKEYQKNLEYLANYDALTSLPNRNLLVDRLKQSMAQTLRHQNLLGVVFIDLDGFKFINDTYGHDCGDRLLVTISNRLKLSLRGVDTIARLGGDEFVILLTDLKTKEDSFHTLTRILQTINDEVFDNGNMLLVSASLGVSFYPQGDKIIEFSELIKQADQAMYQAKLQGKNRCMIYDDVKDEFVAPNAGFEPATK